MVYRSIYLPAAAATEAIEPSTITSTTLYNYSSGELVRRILVKHACSTLYLKTYHGRPLHPRYQHSPRRRSNPSQETGQAPASRGHSLMMSSSTSSPYSTTSSAPPPFEFELQCERVHDWFVVQQRKVWGCCVPAVGDLRPALRQFPLSVSNCNTDTIKFCGLLSCLLLNRGAPLTANWRSPRSPRTGGRFLFPTPCPPPRG